ncbi:DDE-type integrase/transposase/recombinase [Paraburkholderia phymatum]|uniref:DDE-type integrase/transposase/recombinase n=1 Tax=Paraburkholderia phymatum TaxID=148447 RepID=UPI0032AEEE00
MGHDSRPVVANRRDLCEDSWKMAYLYRAVDRARKTIDFRISAMRDIAAAKAFLTKAIRTHERS